MNKALQILVWPLSPPLVVHRLQSAWLHRGWLEESYAFVPVLLRDRTFIPYSLSLLHNTQRHHCYQDCDLKELYGNRKIPVIIKSLCCGYTRCPVALGGVDTICKMCRNSSYSSETLRVFFLKEESRVGWRKMRIREESVLEGQARPLLTPPWGKAWNRQFHEAEPRNSEET